METRDDTAFKKAIAELDGTTVEERMLKVMEAKLNRADHGSVTTIHCVGMMEVVTIKKTAIRKRVLISISVNRVSDLK